MTRKPLWPQLEALVMAHQPDGYTAPTVEGENGRVHLYHSPLRQDLNPSFIIWHDTPEKPGGYYDRATGEGGNLYELLQLLTTEEQPAANGNGHAHARVEVRKPQTMAQFCDARKLDPTILARTFGVHRTGGSPGRDRPPDRGGDKAPR